jgi:hypothetical protein
MPSGSISSVSQSTSSIAASVIDAQAERAAAKHEAKLATVGQRSLSNFAKSERADDSSNLSRVYISKRTGEIEVSSNVFSHFIRKLSGHIVGREALHLAGLKEYGAEALEKLEQAVKNNEGPASMKDLHAFLEASSEPDVQPFDEDANHMKNQWQHILRSDEGPEDKASPSRSVSSQHHMEDIVPSADSVRKMSQSVIDKR